MIEHEAFVQEFVKLAEERVVEVPLKSTPEGMPFPPHPGKRYVARYFSDPLLVAGGTAIGTGLGQLLASRLKKVDVSGPKGKFINIARMAVPVIAGAGASLTGAMISEKRKQRLLEAIEADEREKLRKEMGKDKK